MTDKEPSVEQLRNVPSADVYKAGILAGSLTRDQDDVVFRYRSQYLMDPHATGIAVTLPLSDKPVRAAGGSVPPFFAGLLPEGLRLTALISATRTSADDHLTLLMTVGAEAIGDVQVSPTDFAPNAPPSLFDENNTERINFGELFATATSSDPSIVDRVALPGVQDKVSAGIASTPVNATSGPAILKLSHSGYPRIVENEDFFLRMAADCGLVTPRHRMVRDRDGQPGLMVTRFDRFPDGGRYRRLPQEDACQVMGRYPSAKYQISLEECIRALAAAVEVNGGSRPLAIRRALELAAYSYLIGNGDLHAKNLSIHQDPRGIWALTPAYDLLTTQPYFGWRDPMAINLFGRGNRLSRRWWLDAANRLGLPERAIGGRLDRIVRAALPWLDRLAEIGFDAPTTERLRQLIGTRATELSV